MTGNDSKSFLSYLNELVDKYNNTYHCSISKKNYFANYFPLSEEIELNHKAPNFKVGEKVRITKYKSIFSKGCIEHW